MGRGERGGEILGGQSRQKIFKGERRGGGEGGKDLRGRGEKGRILGRIFGRGKMGNRSGGGRERSEGEKAAKGLTGDKEILGGQRMKHL